MKYILFFLFLFLSNTNVSAQYSYTVGLGYNFLVGEHSNSTTIGLNMVGDYIFNNKNSCLLNIEFYLPTLKENIGNAKARNIFVDPQNVPVKYSSELYILQMSAGYKRYILGGFEELISLYGTASIGVIVAPYNLSIDDSSYDKSDYVITEPDIPFSKRSNEIYGFVSINTGLGGEIALTDVLYLTGELKLSIPVYSFDIKPGNSDIDLGGALRIKMGIKYIIDEIYIFDNFQIFNLNGF